MEVGNRGLFALLKLLLLLGYKRAEDEAMDLGPDIMSSKSLVVNKQTKEKEKWVQCSKGKLEKG